MSQAIKIVMLALYAALLGACAVGNVYDYRTAPVILPVQGTHTVTLTVTDQREYVLNGKKDSDFIGLRRGGYGNPFNVTTASGAPLTDDIREALSNALRNAGYQVNTEGATRNIELVVREWKSDVYTNLKVIFDVDLIVRSETGEELARNTIAGEEAAGGGAMMDQHNESVRRAFEAKMSLLFSDPGIKAALEG